MRQTGYNANHRSIKVIEKVLLPPFFFSYGGNHFRTTHKKPFFPFHAARSDSASKTNERATSLPPPILTIDCTTMWRWHSWRRTEEGGGGERRPLALRSGRIENEAAAAAAAAVHPGTEKSAAMTQGKKKASLPLLSDPTRLQIGSLWPLSLGDKPSSPSAPPRSLPSDNGMCFVKGKEGKRGGGEKCTLSPPHPTTTFSSKCPFPLPPPTLLPCASLRQSAPTRRFRCTQYRMEQQQLSQTLEMRRPTKRSGPELGWACPLPLSLLTYLSGLLCCLGLGSRRCRFGAYSEFRVRCCFGAWAKGSFWYIQKDRGVVLVHKRGQRYRFDAGYVRGVVLYST